MTAAPSQNLLWTRLLLIASAVIAILSVGMSTFRGKESAAPPAATEQNAPDIDEVISRLEERLKQEPSSAEGWQLLGWAYSQGSRPADAVGAYRRATELEPRKAELWSALGESLLASQRGFSEEARAAFDKALSLDPQNVGARFFLAAAKAEGGDANGAVDDWITLLKDAPADAPWATALRQRIEEVAAANGIDVAARLPASGEPKR